MKKHTRESPVLVFLYQTDESEVETLNCWIGEDGKVRRGVVLERERSVGRERERGRGGKGEINEIINADTSRISLCMEGTHHSHNSPRESFAVKYFFLFFFLDVIFAVNLTYLCKSVERTTRGSWPLSLWETTKNIPTRRRSSLLVSKIVL